MTIGSQQPDRGVRQAEPSSSRGDSADVHLAGILARLCAAIISKVPVGYEDETGFHFGRHDTIIIPSTGLGEFKKLLDDMIKTSNELPPKSIPPG